MESWRIFRGWEGFFWRQGRFMLTIINPLRHRPSGLVPANRMVSVFLPDLKGTTWKLRRNEE